LVEKGCYMMAAGKAATLDGSVMVARSCDAFGDYAQQILAVPRRKHGSGEKLRFPKSDGVEIAQVPETYAYLGVMSVVEGEDIHTAQGGINEFQVCAGASTGGVVSKKAEAVCPKMPTSIGDYRMTLVLERCKTAREGIELIGELTERYGARTDNYIVGDPNEVWLYEEFRGRLWAAARVSDDCYVVEANTCRIGEVDLSDPRNFMGAKNLQTFAAERGLHERGSKEPFNVMKTYSAQNEKVKQGIAVPEYDRRRIWRGISLLSPTTKLNPEDPAESYPLFVKPDKKLAPRDFLAIFNDHYQGTKFDPYGSDVKEYTPAVARGRADWWDDPTRKKSVEYQFQLNRSLQYQMAPIWGTERIIGTPAAVTTWCAQLRSNMPVGGLLWAGLAEGRTSAHVPFYSAITKTPEAYTIGSQQFDPMPTEAFSGSVYDEESAYWTFRHISNLVNLFYTATKEEVIPVWRKWEEELYRLQPLIERTALNLFERDPNTALEFLTSYSNMKATEALEIARSMIRKLHTIIAHCNAPL
jgi:dipeptidase